MSCVKELESYSLEMMEEMPGPSQSVPGDQLLPHPSESHQSLEGPEHNVIVIGSDTDSEEDREESEEEEEEEEDEPVCSNITVNFVALMYFFTIYLLPPFLGLWRG